MACHTPKWKINKDTKTPGGTCHFNLNPSAVSYYLTSEYRSAYIGMLQLHEMVQVNKPDLQHADMHSPRIIKDEKALSKVIDIDSDLVNPFRVFSELLNIANATVAPHAST